MKFFFLALLVACSFNLNAQPGQNARAADQAPERTETRSYNIGKAVGQLIIPVAGGVVALILVIRSNRRRKNRTDLP